MAQRHPGEVRPGDRYLAGLGAHLPGLPAGRVWAHGPAGRRRRPERKRRADLRLVLPALFVWGTAAAGNWLSPAGMAGLCIALAAAAGAPLLLAGRGPVAPRSLRATLAVALLLAVAAGAHAAVEASRRHDGPIAEAVAARAAVVAELEVSGAPRRLRVPGAGGVRDRWAVPVMLKAVTFGGRSVAGDVRLVVMGGTAWEHVLPGQRLRATGKLRPAAPGEPDAGILAASSPPAVHRDPGPLQRGPGELRRAFAVASEPYGGDAAGLLPGMVTGDTSALNPELEDAMKTVGMTHLTAVSGANCSLILGTLLLTARMLRLPRPAAAATSLAGLGLFVLMVGPDPSVLRAALMGSIGLGSVAFGRAARGLSLLCVAVIGLLLADPVLATRFGFLLSVLATLGIVVAGRRIMEWLPPPVPRWAAAGVAVPLSAQLFCGPAIVLLQPQFGPYALPANVAAAALVAPVTLLGTAAAVLLPAVPAAAGLLMAAAAAFAGAVAWLARFFAALPGAVLPWPEGSFGVGTMAAFSATVLVVVWLVLHPAAALRTAWAAHARVVAALDSRAGAAGRSVSRQAATRPGRWTRRSSRSRRRQRLLGPFR